MQTKNFRLHVIWAVITFLSACGGSSSDSDDNNGLNPNASAEDFLCPSHVAGQTNVIGNNTYEFIASAGNCFGMLADQGLVKQAVDVIAEQYNVNPQNDSLVSFEATAKLTSNRVPAMSGGYLFLYLGIELTNSSSSDACVEISGAVLEEQDDTEMTEIELELLGDMFYGSAPTYRFHTNCIPPGETRVAWGDKTELSSFNPGEDVNALDHIRISFQVRIPDGINEYYLEALTPNEAAWTSDKQTISGTDYYYYTIANDFINETAEDMVFHSRIVDIVYFDENDYVIFSSLSTIDDYLGIDDNDLVDDDFVLSAVGGGIGVQDGYGPIVPSLDALTSINGRASKIVIGLDVCNGITNPGLC